MQPTLWPEDDICRGKHGGNAESEAANRQTRKQRDQATIYAWIHARGRRGATGNEVVRALHMLPQTVSARCSEMRRDGYLLPDGRKRLTRPGNCPAAVLLTVGVARRVIQPGPEQLPLFEGVANV